MKLKALALAAALALMTAAAAEGPLPRDVDIDLFPMNANINYAHMKQVLADPAAYAGKTLCVRGKLSYSEAAGIPMIILCDASGCCEITLRFDPAQPMTWPDDYPPLYADVAVAGTLTLEDNQVRLTGARLVEGE